MVLPLHHSKILLKKEHYYQLIENSPLLTVFYDKEGYIFQVNKAWQKFFNLSPETVIGIYNVNEDPLVRQWGIKKYWDAIQNGGFATTHDFEYDAKETGLPGKKIWLRGHFGSVKDEQNEIVFYYIQMEEVSERKQLEDIVIQNQKWDTLQTFSGGIAHDLNNILTSFTGSLSLVKEEYLDKITQQFPECSELFLNLEIGVTNATQLANQLLIFSKGNLPLKKYTKLEDIIKDSIGFISHGKKVEINFDFPDNLWKIIADPAQISQVFQNIALNSIQAMNDSGKITISSRNHILEQNNKYGLNPGEYILTVISDTGPGIPPSIMPKIFEMYFSTKKDGIGLGLSVANSIIQRHNGHLEFIPAISEGATAILLLPADSNIKILPKEDFQNINHFGGKILVLDDDPNIRIVLHRMCSFLKLEIEMCSNSDEALSIYSKALNSSNPFDLVITDLTLKHDIDGKSFFQKILAIDENAKGIIMSGYSNSDVMANYAKYGFQNRLRKPFTLTELKVILSQYLKSTQNTE